MLYRKPRKPGNCVKVSRKETEPTCQHYYMVHLLNWLTVSRRLHCKISINNWVSAIPGPSLFFLFFALFICHIEEKEFNCDWNCVKKRELKEVSSMPVPIVACAWSGETQPSIFSWCYRVCCGCEWPIMQINTGQILICCCFIFCVYCNKPVAPKVDFWHLLLVYKKM